MGHPGEPAAPAAPRPKAARAAPAPAGAFGWHHLTATILDDWETIATRLQWK